MLQLGGSYYFWVAEPFSLRLNGQKSRFEYSSDFKLQASTENCYLFIKKFQVSRTDNFVMSQHLMVEGTYE